MSTATSTKTTTTPDSLRWPIALALLLASGMGVSLAFLWIAVRQTPDLIPGGGWNAGTRYNADLRATEAATRRGWTLELRAARSADGVRVELVPASAGEPLPADLELHLRRERPERADLDADQALWSRGSRWFADVALPLPGRWILVARAGDATAWVERSFALDVPP